MYKLSLGFSPCPNDTFIFDALVHHKIDTEGLEFEPIIADVEELNRLTFKKEIDVTKISFHAFLHLANTYQLLNAGSALGENCGPLLISSQERSLHDVADLSIAIPGRYTTANLLLSFAAPEANKKIEMLFSDIEQAVIQGQVDAGLIIHENRFTYQQKGLKKIVDLGAYWEHTTGHPIPLGGIIMKRNIPDSVIQKMDRVLKRSVAFAFENPESAKPFIKAHAQELEEEVIYQHIHLYVNNYTRELGTKGQQAIRYLFHKALETGVIKTPPKHLFTTE